MEELTEIKSNHGDMEDTPILSDVHEKLVDCPDCGGDGRETCNNPDHGFIDGVGGETKRLGCPVCGHDPDHKTKNKCDTCGGSGIKKRMSDNAQGHTRETISGSRVV
jgi:hypothetical protein